jgi:hypothetical protein
MPWNILKVPRSGFFREGFTFGKGWDTVEAVRLTVKVTEAANLEIRFDDIRQYGGPIYGEVEYKYVYVRDDGTYVTKSAPSEASTRYVFEAEGAAVEIPADGSRDSQINQIWLYRRGAGLDAFYRVAVEEVSGGGALTINDTLSANDALIINEKLDEDCDVPPDNIIDIEGPYYDRLFVLTATHLYPSRRLQPDTFSESQEILVAGSDETCLWVKKALGGLYIGTTKDIYWLRGTGAELPDGTMDFTLEPLNIDNPPRSEAVAQEGNLLVFLAADGWRAIQGGGTQLLVGATSLLYRGKARHGVSAINMGGRFRATIGQGNLLAVTPEGIATTSSSVLYRYRFGTSRWYRHVYPTSIRAIYREPDGVVTFSDTAGFVWLLDSGTQDIGEDIPVVMWTREDDAGHPFARKDPHDMRVLLETGGDPASVSFHLDHAAQPTLLIKAERHTMGESLFNLRDFGLKPFKALQLRITGSFEAFRWANFNLGLNPLPMVTRGHTSPSEFGYPGVKTTVGIQLRLCTLGVTRTVTPILDGVKDEPFEVRSERDEPIDFTHMFEYPARQVREFQLYVDGDHEMYNWEPLVTAKVPLGTLVWDSGPMDVKSGEFIWPREVWIKAVCGDDLYVEPYFDGVPYGAVVVPVAASLRGTAAKLRIPIPRGYKGRVPRFVITSCEPFYPYWYEFVQRDTRAGLEKEPLRIDAKFGQQVAL